jgi:hypothetical protein
VCSSWQDSSCWGKLWAHRKRQSWLQQRHGHPGGSKFIRDGLGSVPRFRLLSLAFFLIFNRVVRNKRQGKPSSQKAMEEASSGVSSSEPTVRGKLSLVWPTAKSTLWCPSSLTLTRHPSNTRMPKGAPPVQDGVNLAVVPKGNGPLWPSRYSLSSLREQRNEHHGMDPPTVHVTLDRSRWWCERQPLPTAGRSLWHR